MSRNLGKSGGRGSCRAWKPMSRTARQEPRPPDHCSGTCPHELGHVGNVPPQTRRHLGKKVLPPQNPEDPTMRWWMALLGFLVASAISAQVAQKSDLSADEAVLR